MTIKDCINKIQPSLAVLVEGAWVEPESIPFKDGTTGLKFACPYCMSIYSRPPKEGKMCSYFSRTCNTIWVPSLSF